jgi:hypothetical protein
MRTGLRVTAGPGSPGSPVGPDQQSGSCGQRSEEPGGDRIELAHVPKGERAQERPEPRGRVRLGEDPAHPAVPQQRRVIDRVGAGDHPRHEGGHLQPGIRALVGRHTQTLIGQASQTGPVGQRQHRDQPGGRHKIRVVEGRRGLVTAPVSSASVGGADGRVLADTERIARSKRDSVVVLPESSRYAVVAPAGLEGNPDSR